MKQTFEFDAGALWLRCEDTQSNEPKKIISHYLFFKCWQSDCEHLHGLPAYSVGNGVYAAHVSGQSLEFRLDCGGQTKPGKFQIVDVERPKSKRQTRWHNGGWQLLFKTGWRAA